MKLILPFLLLLFFCSCYTEDPRARDFSLEYDLEDARWKSQWVEGTVTNLSDIPSDKLKIKVDMYECNRRVNHRIIKVKETLYQNEQADFCVTVGDTITSVELTVIKVE